MSRQRWLRLGVVGALGALMITTTGGFTTRKRVAKPGPVLSVSPTAVTFATVSVGAFDYQMVTITNSGDATDYISTATADAPFFPTFGGTCNTSIDPNDPNHRNYWIPAGSSCTFQWAFNPTTHPGKYTGTGTLIFDVSSPLNVSLTGKAKH